MANNATNTTRRGTLPFQGQDQEIQWDARDPWQPIVLALGEPLPPPKHGAQQSGGNGVMDPVLT